MRKLPPQLGCVLWLCLAVVTARAQYRFDHWTADNGLPQNSVRDIVQMRDGYLWLTTFDGLVRFDGVRFTVFNKGNTPGIATNRFVKLYEDGQGDLWASTENGDALTRRHNGRFTTFTKENGLPHQTYRDLGGDGQGHLVLFGKEQVWRWMENGFQAADGVRLPVQSPVQAHDTAARDVAQHLATCPESPLRFWGAGTTGFLGDFALRVNAGAPMQDWQGRIWIGSATGVLRYEQGKWQPTGMPDGALAGRPTGLVYGWQPLHALTFAADGSLWLTNIESGQNRLVAAHPPEGLQGLASYGGDIFTAYGDKEGNLWIGTAHYGLYRARPQSLTTYALPPGRTNPEVYPILQDQDGTLWVGSGTVFRRQNGVFTRYDGQASFATNITSLYQDRAGQFWVNGQWRWDQERFVRSFSYDLKPESLKEIWTMYEDHTGAVWRGGSDGVIRVQDGVPTRFTTRDGLAGDDTKVIIDDGADGLWLGSYGGLTHYRNGQFQRWTEADGLPGNTVRALKQDADGTLWIGTYDSGLGRFKEGKFTRYTVRDGLFDNGVFQMLEDDYGWCWMSCNRGIYRVRKQELNDFADGKIKTIHCIAYGKSDGMENVECNGGRWPAGVKTRDGKLWFPTMGGVVVIDPANVKANTQPPPVVIEAMRINNEAVPVDLLNSAIEIKPGQESFEIEYSALSFINSGQLKFRYKLENLESDWVEAGTRRTAYFSHVPPGSYTFKVIAANSDGVWNETGQSLRITVLPPFYRTWWFLTLATLLVGGVVFGAYEFRVLQIKRRQAAQQNFARQLIASQEAERKRIAAELHDSLGQHLVVIKNLALMWLQRHTDDAAQPIRDISATTSQAISEVKEISYNLRPYQLDRIGLTKAIEGLLKKAEAASDIRFTAALDDLQDALPKESEINFYRIVQECVNNILKHSRATAASVTIRRRGQTLRLTIQDNGQGFTPGVAAGDRHGFGLIGINERAQLLGGQAVIQSAPNQGPNQGTTITLELALSPGDKHEQ